MLVTNWFDCPFIIIEMSTFTLTLDCASLGPEINIKDQLEPTLLCDVPITSQLLLEIDGGPIIITIPFRTVKESISMFNHDKLGCDVSIWTDKLSLALEVAPQLKTGTVWVNSQNLFDAAAAYGGASLGSNSIEGGIEVFYNHLNFRIPVSKKYSKEEADQEIKSYGLDTPSGFKVKSDQSIKHSYEHHIGGSYKKSAGNSYLIIQDSNKKPYAYVANGSSSDIKDAVSNAVAAQPKWETVDKYKRSEIFRKTSNALKGKKEEFITQLHDLTGKEISKCTEEVDSTIHHLITLSIYVATKEKESLDTKFSGQVFKDFLPVGVIGIQCPDQDPLLSFAYLVSTAVIYGNTVAVIPSENFPCLALKMCEIFRSSGIPSGVVNVVCGNRPHLTRHLCSNLNVSALWFVEGHAFINHSRTVYPRRVFDCRDVWKLTYINKCRASMESTQIKVTYMPAGTIFAN
ncbi:aldehyde dehydrogenase family 16 member A1 [Caerostris extrusa]|uniref:Aldehyde dehydrogenase family 16 member A1 n=1 Tax=Caerostris extrusa TaxID=172846 RepID=A0AAV4M9I8_CAEEX|nr:aldehyde dehydrogenase family 16 member A1 [Caerostris extrusa]